MSATGAHRTDIEGLRAIAVGLVLLYHAQLPWFSGGFLGVDVFFVISGFLITSSLVREADDSGTIRLGRFYARRARRLLPAAAVVLLVTAAGVRALLPATTWRDFGGDIAAAAGYVVNWRFALRSVDYLAEDVVASPVQHFWSLAIEEQYYLVWPLLIIVAVAVARWRGADARRTMLVALVGLVVVPSLVWSVVQTAARPSIAFFDTGTRMWELAAGGVVALVGPGRLAQERWRVPLKAAAVVVILGLGVGLDETVPWPGVLALGAVVPTALLLLLGGRGDDPVERLLSVRPAQHVGAWSYSLYLWHWPPLAILAARWDGLSVRQAVLIVALSVPFAVASYHLVENPLRYAERLKRSTGLTLSVGANLSLAGVLAGVVVVLAVPAGGGTGTLVLEPGPPVAAPTTDDDPDGDDPGDPVVPAGTVGAPAFGEDPTVFSDEQWVATLAQVRSITPAPTGAVDDLPRVYEDRCHTPIGEPQPRVCTYGDPDADVHVALVGDSKAGQWGDAVEQVVLANGWRATYYLKSACELSTAMPDIRDEPDEACATWVERVFDRLEADPPDVVLASQVSATAYSDDPDADRREVLVQGMVEAYEQVEALGARMVVLLDNHNPGMNVYECIAEQLEDLAACTFPRERGGASRSVQTEAAQRAGVAVLDLADRICPTESCLPVVGNVLVYRQGSHLSRTYVESLVPTFTARFEPLVAEAVAASAAGR